MCRRGNYFVWGPIRQSEWSSVYNSCTVCTVKPMGVRIQFVRRPVRLAWGEVVRNKEAAAAEKFFRCRRFFVLLYTENPQIVWGFKNRLLPMWY